MCPPASRGYGGGIFLQRYKCYGPGYCSSSDASRNLRCSLEMAIDSAVGVGDDGG